MSLPKSSILGVSVTTSSRKAILSYVSRFLSPHRLSSPSSIQIVTPNAEQIVLAQKDEKFKTILNSADIALPDGAGVVWGMNRKQKTVLRISGIDFMVDICRAAAGKHGRVFFYGGRGGVAGEALKKLKEHIPGLDGIAEDGAEFGEKFTNNELRIMNNEKNSINSSFDNLKSIEEDVIKHLVQVIRGRNISIVFIGLGAPKQEYLMDALRLSYAHCPMPLAIMAVGGSFDVLAGKISRAPKFVQTIGFEWLYRLIQEPWRWKRQWALVEFVRLVLFGKSNDN